MNPAYVIYEKESGILQLDYSSRMLCIFDESKDAEAWLSKTFNKINKVGVAKVDLGVGKWGAGGDGEFTRKELSIAPLMNSKLKVAILNDYFIQGTPHAVLVEKYSITKEELDNLIYLIESNLA